VVHAHLKSIMPDNPRPDAPIFRGGGARPNARFQALCDLADIKPRTDIETGEDKPWERIAAEGSALHGAASLAIIRSFQDRARTAFQT